MTDPSSALSEALASRFGEPFEVPPDTEGLDELLRIATHLTHRRWADRPVTTDMVRLLAACALSAPSKSDLQQADIVHVREPARLDAIAALVPQMPWLRSAPAFLVFCGNGRRLRRLFARRGQPFVNEHLDAFFNPTVDAALAMMNFIRAAEAAGLACCPISVLRDRAADLSGILQLPDHVFPVAGLCAGYPAASLSTNPRLSLRATFHVDRFDDEENDALIDEFDERWARARSRRAVAPGTLPAAAAPAGTPRWSDEKAKQYATPQRADWGAFIRAKGFDLA
jgi:nitroreductase/FMN reductase [NAD(P)H]